MQNRVKFNFVCITSISVTFKLSIFYSLQRYKGKYVYIFFHFEQSRKRGINRLFRIDKKGITYLNNMSMVYKNFIRHTYLTILKHDMLEKQQENT